MPDRRETHADQRTEDWVVTNERAGGEQLVDRRIAISARRGAEDIEQVTGWVVRRRNDEAMGGQMGVITVLCSRMPVKP